MCLQIGHILSCKFYCFKCVFRIFTHFVTFVLLVVITQCVVGHDSFNSSTLLFIIAIRYNYALMCRFPHPIRTTSAIPNNNPSPKDNQSNLQSVRFNHFLTFRIIFLCHIATSFNICSMCHRVLLFFFVYGII